MNMPDRNEQLRQDGIKRDKARAEKARKDADSRQRLSELPINETMGYQQFEITAVVGGWLYTLITAGGQPVTTTFVGDPTHE